MADVEMPTDFEAIQRLLEIGDLESAREILGATDANDDAYAALRQNWRCSRAHSRRLPRFKNSFSLCGVSQPYPGHARFSRKPLGSRTQTVNLQCRIRIIRRPCATSNATLASKSNSTRNGKHGP